MARLRGTLGDLVAADKRAWDRYAQACVRKASDAERSSRYDTARRTLSELEEREAEERDRR